VIGKSELGVIRCPPLAHPEEAYRFPELRHRYLDPIAADMAAIIWVGDIINV